MQDALQSLRHETNEAAALIANMKDVLGDEDAVLLAIDSETDLNGAIAAGLTRIIEAEAIAEMIDALKKRLDARADRFEKQAENLRTAICSAMETAGIKSVEHVIGTVSVRRTPPQVLVTDEAALPTKFFKPQPPKLDKRELLKALKDGEMVRGAQLTNGGITLAIR